MGRLRNIIAAKVSGNVGAMSFRNRGAETVVAERSYTNSSAGKGATEAQRIHRSRLANIVNFFRAIKEIEKRAWEGKRPYVSDFNMFTSLNLSSSPIFLTKQEAALGAAVIAPYGVARGTLAPLGGAYEGTAFNIGLMVEDGGSFDQMTVADFSAKVVANNPGWNYNDKLSLCILRQVERTLSGMSIPQVEVTYLEITLDGESSTLLEDLANWDAVQPDFDNDGNLQFLDGGDAAFAVHSRESSGHLETSDQDIVVAFPANATFTKYSSDMQKQLAMDSYGYKEDVLLNPYSEIEAQIIEPAWIQSVMFGAAPLVDGSTITEAGTLSITGENISRNNVQVMNGAEVYVPTVDTSTNQQFTISYPGNYRIYINGNLAYSFTSTYTPTQSVTSVKFGADTSTTIPVVGASIVQGQSKSIDVYGENLGELSATLVTLSSVSGDASHRTATVTGPSVVTGGFTISAGNQVIVQGNVTDH